MPAPTVLPGRAFQQVDRRSQLAFHWRAADLSLVTVGKESTGVFSRASAGGQVVGKGGVRTTTRNRLLGPAADGMPRFELVALNAGSTRNTNALALGEQLTNLMDEDDLTNWTGESGPVVSTGQTGPGRLLDAYTVEDNGGASVEYIHRAVGYTGDGAKAISFGIRENTTPAGGQRIMMIGDTGPTTHLSATIDDYTNGEPNITMDTGTELQRQEIGDGYWWIDCLSSTDVVAANDHRVEIYPAIVAAQTGILDVHRINTYNALVPLNGILSESISQAAETLYWPFNMKPQAMTMYVKLIERGDVAAATVYGVFGIQDVNSANPKVEIFADGTRYEAIHDNGTQQVEAQGALTQPSMGDTVELCLRVANNGSLVLGQSINGGAQETVSGATPVPFAPAWSAPRLYLSSRGNFSRGFGGFLAAKVATGIRSMEYMRQSL